MDFNEAPKQKAEIGEAAYRCFLRKVGFRVNKSAINGCFFVLALAMLSGCQDANEWQGFQEIEAEVVLLGSYKVEDLSSIEPLRALRSSDVANIPKEMAQLGKFLFHDKRLSKDKSISCASCHDLANGGDDGLEVSVGVGGALGAINSPTVLNSGFNFRQFWDGRASSLQEQAEGPVGNPMEMSADWETVVKELNADSQLREKFKSVFGDHEITQERVTRAIADFEKTLVTPAPFDQYLLGDENAISEDAKAGYRLFKRRGCVACHQGINVGGNLYQKFGAIQTYFESDGAEDLGLGRRTNRDGDMSVFKVPSLRNVAKTSPYFHNAGAKDLKTAIFIMGVMQLGLTLPDVEIARIEAFLNTLSGEVPVLADSDVDEGQP